MSARPGRYPRSVKRILPLALVLAVVAGGATALAVVLSRDGGRTFRGSIPPQRIELPDFALGSADGRPVRSRDLRGQVVLVTFLNSACRESCPIVAAQVARGLRLLGRDERSDVVALAVSTLPRVDTPPRVRAFLRRQGALGEIHYLIGSERELRPVWRAFQILPAVDSGDADVHSAPVRIFDRHGRWVSTLHAGVDLTPENVRHDLRQALS